MSLSSDTMRWLEKRANRYKEARSGKHWFAMWDMANRPSKGGAFPEDFLDRVAQSRVQLTYDEVIEAVKASPLSKLSVNVLDHKQHALPLQVWKEYLYLSDVDQYKYEADSRDCDNFALALTANSALKLNTNGIGFVADISGGHAYNCLLCHDNDTLSVQIVEPQTDGFVKIGEGISRNEIYKAEQGWILFA